MNTVTGAGYKPHQIALVKSHFGSTAFINKRWINLPNSITWIRILARVAVFMFAAHLQSEMLNFIGLALYWLLYVVDSGVPRFMRQETRSDAQLDILGDRLLISCFYFNYIQFHPYKDVKTIN